MSNLFTEGFLEILEELGFEVYLVNARHTKNLPGRKSDVQESQWLLKRTPTDYSTTRSNPRRKSAWCGRTGGNGGSMYEERPHASIRMQKALAQMNVQLANVISDLSGLTGQAIVRAILAGERDPKN